MELQWVTTFLAVVEHQGFARAADVLHCSQPTVSNHVASLERELGAPLLQRYCRPVALTEAGAAFLPHGRALVREFETARSSVADVTGLRSGSVTLGAYASAAAGYVPGLLRSFRKRHPRITVRLVESRADDLAQAALTGQVEIFLRPTTPPLSVASFAHQLLWRERYKVVLHHEHPLAAHAGPVPIDELVNLPLIMTGHGELASPHHPLWRSLDRYPDPAYEVTHPQSLIELVRAGLGAGVTNEVSLNVSAVDGLEIRDISADAAQRDVAVWWLTGRVPSPAARALVAAMRSGPRPCGVQPLA